MNPGEVLGFLGNKRMQRLFSSSALAMIGVMGTLLSLIRPTTMGTQTMVTPAPRAQTPGGFCYARFSLHPKWLLDYFPGHVSLILLYSIKRTKQRLITLMPIIAFNTLQTL